MARGLFGVVLGESFLICTSHDVAGSFLRGTGLFQSMLMGPKIGRGPKSGQEIITVYFDVWLQPPVCPSWLLWSYRLSNTFAGSPSVLPMWMTCPINHLLSSCDSASWVPCCPSYSLWYLCPPASGGLLLPPQFYYLWNLYPHFIKEPSSVMSFPPGALTYRGGQHLRVVEAFSSQHIPYP